ncbi:hypothetical protein T265_10700 [Opisthorchis viverrini]|uniref:Uncharacterized protein n=1 Tax=Opisthorchis viverrini TaxID=6198 RepID=A0A074Z195_OPIVI|nr:hypothetical protein T265_10700 [Opisthorchis viverrini]KER20826.1 hypothetical protein T265_10700 [Opisthorchis viverrini]
MQGIAKRRRSGIKVDNRDWPDCDEAAVCNLRLLRCPPFAIALTVPFADEDLRPRFPGTFCSCPSTAAVFLKVTSKKGKASLFKFAARDSKLAFVRAQLDRLANVS